MAVITTFGQGREETLVEAQSGRRIVVSAIEVTTQAADTVVFRPDPGNNPYSPVVPAGGVVNSIPANTSMQLSAVPTAIGDRIVFNALPTTEISITFTYQ